MAMPTAVPMIPDSASGSVEAATLAEAGLKTVGHPEDAAEPADVLAEDDDAVIRRHLVGEGRGERSGHRQGADGRRRLDRCIVDEGHAVPPSLSLRASSSRRLSHWSSSCGGRWA